MGKKWVVVASESPLKIRLVNVKVVNRKEPKNLQTSEENTVRISPSRNVTQTSSSTTIPGSPAIPSTETNLDVTNPVYSTITDITLSEMTHTSDAKSDETETYHASEESTVHISPSRNNKHMTNSSTTIPGSPGIPSTHMDMDVTYPVYSTITDIPLPQVTPTSDEKYDETEAYHTSEESTVHISPSRNNKHMTNSSTVIPGSPAIPSTHMDLDVTYPVYSEITDIPLPEVTPTSDAKFDETETYYLATKKYNLPTTQDITELAFAASKLGNIQYMEQGFPEMVHAATELYITKLLLKMKDSRSNLGANLDGRTYTIEDCSEALKDFPIPPIPILYSEYNS